MKDVFTYLSGISDWRYLLVISLIAYVLWLQRNSVSLAISTWVKSKFKSEAKNSHACLKEPILSEVVKDIRTIQNTVSSLESKVQSVVTRADAEAALGKERHDAMIRELNQLREMVMSINNLLLKERTGP